MKNRFIVCFLILAGVVFVSQAFAGGSRQAQDTQGPTHLRILVTNSMGNDPSQLRLTKILEEGTNTSLEFIEAGTGNDYLQKLNVVMASGDYPDIFAVTNNSTELDFARNGAMVPLNQHWDRYPNIRNSRTPDIWNVMTHPDGNVYVIPRNGRLGNHVVNHVNWMLLFRQDYLERAGMSVPRTLDEYWRFLEFVRDADG